jgi:transposase-like protein
VEEFMDVLGRAALEAVLELSAQQVAGPRHQGQPGGDIRRHGTQGGVVTLSTQKVRVRKPRLRRKGGGQAAEVPIPAYEAMQDDTGLQAKLSDILMSGVSTRKYERVIPEMAERCGVSKSSVSREFIEASAEKLQELAQRRFDELDLLVIYIDGLRFGDHHVIAALGVDFDGYKHILGLRAGATENAVVVKHLLTELVERGVDPARRRLFVIDGSKALRVGVDAVFGTQHPVQRCRNHKIQNVMGYLPEELKDQVKAVMKAAYHLPADEGLARLKQQARWLEQEYPSAAASLLEGLEELFTINRLGLPPKLRRCLGTTNIVESPSAGVRIRTRRVTRWKDGAMVLRWAATAFLATEANFRRIIGYQELWTLRALLDDDVTQTKVAAA